MLKSLTLSIAILSVALQAQQGGRGGGAGIAGGRVPTIEERVAGMHKIDGYFPLYWDERTGNLWLEISRFDTDFLISDGLAAGHMQYLSSSLASDGKIRMSKPHLSR